MSVTIDCKLAFAGRISRAAKFGRVGLLLLFLAGSATTARQTLGGEFAANVSGPRDLRGRPVDPFDGRGGKGVVLFFLRTDCPISNRYAPEIRRLYEKYSPQGFAFWLVYADADTSGGEIARHLRDYRLPPKALRDVQHVLVKRAGAKVTPEVAVFQGDGLEVYDGRIDDRYVDFGKERSAPTQHDLEDALEAVLHGQPVARPTTTAVGCYITELPLTPMPGKP